MPTPVTLPAASWRARETSHAARADALTAGHRARKQRGIPHPIEDFLWTYYSVKPGELRRWHPGAGVILEGAGHDRASWRHYTALSEQHADGQEHCGGSIAGPGPGLGLEPGLGLDATIDLEAFFAKRGATVDYIERLLEATRDRPPQFGCFGLHEWAMIYRLQPEQVRHVGLPLRIGHEATDHVVETHRIACSHFDAYRFFTADAAPLNLLGPTRENQPELEQAGCLHAGMDIYKWAAKLGPILPGETLLDAFVLARDIREVDMRASPYDVSGFASAGGQPLEPIAIETAAGKQSYAALQATFTDRGNALRERVLTAISVARRHHSGTGV